jgi:hypothetical protein
VDPVLARLHYRAFGFGIAVSVAAEEVAPADVDGDWHDDLEGLGGGDDEKVSKVLSSGD